METHCLMKSLIRKSVFLDLRTHRRLHVGQVMCKKPGSLKGRKISSQLWLKRQLNDPFVKLAKYEQWRCRSAFKLLEIDEKHRLFKPGDVVIDCGAAPGSWTQVAVERVNAGKADLDAPVGQVISIDLKQFPPVNGALILSNHDFTEETTQQKILTHLKGAKANAVISDMAPSATGVKSLDHNIIVDLATSAFKFSCSVLKKDGIFLCKIWEGGGQPGLMKEMKKYFESVKVVRPEASRKESAEIFLLAKKFCGQSPGAESQNSASMRTNT